MKDGLGRYGEDIALPKSMARIRVSVVFREVAARYRYSKDIRPPMHGTLIEATLDGYRLAGRVAHVDPGAKVPLTTGTTGFMNHV